MTEQIGDIVTDGTDTQTTDDGTSTGSSHTLQTQPEAYNDNLYVINEKNGNEQYVMDQLIDGNAYIIEDNVKISGMINGSLFLIAKNVEIDENAQIYNGVYILADKITFAGASYDMYALCTEFNMPTTGYVVRDLAVKAEKMELKGMTGRNINVIATEIDVVDETENASTEDNSGENVVENTDTTTDTTTDTATQTSGLVCYGNFNYTSEKPIEDLDKVQIMGETNYTEKGKQENTGKTILNYVATAIENTVFVIVLYAILIFLAPKFVEKTKEYAGTKSIVGFGIGIAFTILIPILAILLFATSVGSGIAMILLMAYFTIFIISYAITTIIVNEFVAKKIPAINNVWKKILIAIPVSLVLFVLRKIPVVGSIVSAVMFLIGIGTIILYQFDKISKKSQKEKSVEQA